jgi:hypothetical protein
MIVNCGHLPKCADTFPLSVEIATFINFSPFLYNSIFCHCLPNILYSIIYQKIYIFYCLIDMNVQCLADLLDAGRPSFHQFKNIMFVAVSLPSRSFLMTSSTSIAFEPMISLNLSSFFLLEALRYLPCEGLEGLFK